MAYQRSLALALAIVAILVTTAVGTSASRTEAGRATYGAPPVTITDWEFPDGFGPQAAVVADAEVSSVMVDGLILIDDKLQVQPDLATTLPASTNGGARIVDGNLIVTWHLKPGLTWADGTPLTADQAIVQTRMFETPEGGYPTPYDQIATMAAPDARTLVITYRGIYASFLYNPPFFYNFRAGARKYGAGDLGSVARGPYNRAAWSAFVGMPGAPTPAYGRSPIHQVVTGWQTDAYTKPDDGHWNGAYKLGSYVPGQRITLVPNPHYTALPPARQAGQTLGRPSRIVFVSISEDPRAYAVALQAPSIAVNKAEDFQMSDLPALRRIRRFRLHVNNDMEVEHLELNRTNRYLADVRVRRALALAVDKVELVHLLFPEARNPATFVVNTFFPSLHPYYDGGVVSHYDLAGARRLLQAAGYQTDLHKPGRHVVLSFDTTLRDPRPKTGEILKRLWAQIGVTLNLHATPPVNDYGGLFATWDRQGILVHRTFDVALFAWSISPDPDVSTFFLPQFIPTAFSHSAGQQNYSAVDDPLVTTTLQRALQSLDVPTRRHWYLQAQQRVADQVYWIPLYTRYNISVEDGTIVNYKPNPSSAGNDWNAFQWSKAATQ